MPKKKSPARKKSSRNRKKKGQSVPTSSGSKERTITIRKIENGYIIREEIYTKNGGYTTRETFTKKPPKLEVVT